VTDTSGAVIPDANVTIENTATHVISKTVTNAAGSYVSADMLPGTYTVTVEKQGFQQRLIYPVNVDVSKGTRADAQLSVGSESQTVEVAAPAIALDTTQPQLGTVIENKITQEIPVLIGGGPGNQGPRDRQIDDYLFLAPGVSGGEWSHRINGGTDFANTVMFNVTNNVSSSIGTLPTRQTNWGLSVDHSLTES
jgi:hypothetical protein